MVESLSGKSYRAKSEKLTWLCTKFPVVVLQSTLRLRTCPSCHSWPPPPALTGQIRSILSPSSPPHLLIWCSPPCWCCRRSSRGTAGSRSWLCSGRCRSGRLHRARDRPESWGSLCQPDRSPSPGHSEWSCRPGPASLSPPADWEKREESFIKSQSATTNIS